MISQIVHVCVKFLNLIGPCGLLQHGRRQVSQNGGANFHYTVVLASLWCIEILKTWGCFAPTCLQPCIVQDSLQKTSFKLSVVCNFLHVSLLKPVKGKGQVESMSPQDLMCCKSLTQTIQIIRMASTSFAGVLLVISWFETWQTKLDSTGLGLSMGLKWLQVNTKKSNRLKRHSYILTKLLLCNIAGFTQSYM